MIGLAAPFSFLYFSVETLFHLKIRFIRLPKVLISGKWVRASATLTYGQPKRWKFGSRELGVMSEEATVYGFGGCVSSSYRFRCTHNMTYGENFIGARLRVPRKTRTEVQLPPPLPPPKKKKTVEGFLPKVIWKETRYESTLEGTFEYQRAKRPSATTQRLPFFHQIVLRLRRGRHRNRSHSSEIPAIVFVQSNTCHNIAVSMKAVGYCSPGST